jgi:hypothetical protein
MQHQSFVERLYNEFREAGYCHVLLDPQAGSPFEGEIAALDSKQAPRFHLRDAVFADAPEQAPLLLSLPLSELQLVEAFAAHAQQEAADPNATTRSVCAFIRSDLPVAQLARRLADALDLKVESRAVYFRYFDPRVFHHVPRLVPGKQFGGMLHGISSWSYFLWDGRLDVQEIPRSEGSLLMGVRLTSEQWQAFEAVEHFNAAQRLFAKHGLRFEPKQTEDMFRKVQAAMSSGLSSPADTAYYVACSLQASEPLSRHPSWPDVLTLVQREVPLADALEQLCSISLRDANADTSTTKLLEPQLP